MSDPYQQNPYQQNPPQQYPAQQGAYEQQPGQGAPYGYPAAPPPPQGPISGPGGLVLDPGSGVYVPPGTQLAGIGRRIGAYFLSIVLVIVTLVIGYVIWGLIAWGKGTTPALQVLGMRCWHTERNEVPGWGRMALREIVGSFIVEGFVPLGNIISFILFLATGKRQALHDMVAGTVVLHDPNKVLG